MSPLLPPALAVGVALLLAGSVLAVWRWTQGGVARRARAWDVLALVAGVGLVAAFFWRVLFTADVYLPVGGGDLASFFYPLYTFIHRSVQAGSGLPLWNPYAFGGAPLAADVQSGLWYPPNLLVWSLVPLPAFSPDFTRAVHTSYALIEWQLIAHYAWAAAGMYLWGRDLRLLRVAALAGAAAFAFTGFMAAHFGHAPMIFAAAWLPWNLLLVRRVVAGASWGWCLALGTTLGLTFLAGHPQTFLYEVLAVALYWGWLEWGHVPAPSAPPAVQRGAARNRLEMWEEILARPQVGRVVRPALVLAIAAGLGMVQLLPAVELAGQSVRSALAWETATQNALQPVGLLQLVLPRIFGDSPAGGTVPWQSNENWGYLGVVALVLAGLSPVLRRDRTTGYGLALGVGALLLSFGPFTQFFAGLHGLVPGFDRFRGAGRLLLEIGLAVGLLAALGLDALLRLLPLANERAQANPLFTRHPALAFRNLVGGLIALCVLLIGFVVPLFTAVFFSSPYIERAGTFLNDLNIGVVWMVLVTGLLGLAWRGRLRAGMLGLALAVLLVADLFAPNAAFNPTTTDVTSGYQNPDQIGLLYSKTGDPAVGAGVRWRIDSDTGGVIRQWQPSTGVLAAIPDAGGLVNPLALHRYDRVWNWIKSPPPGAPAGVKDRRDSAWYDLLNIRYTVAISDDRPLGAKFQEVDSNAQGVKIYENANAMPRAFLVHDVVVLPDPEAQFAAIEKLTVLPNHTVVLGEGVAVQSAVPGSVEGNPADTVTFDSYSPARIALHTTTDTPGWLVLSEVWYPGWIATLDGVRAPVVQADYLLRAVQVGPGSHTLVLEFASRPLLLGQAISATTAAGVIFGALGLIVAGRRRRQAAA